MLEGIVGINSIQERICLQLPRDDRCTCCLSLEMVASSGKRCGVLGVVEQYFTSCLPGDSLNKQASGAGEMTRGGGGGAQTTDHVNAKTRVPRTHVKSQLQECVRDRRVPGKGGRWRRESSGSWWARLPLTQWQIRALPHTRTDT